MKLTKTQIFQTKEYCGPEFGAKRATKNVTVVKRYNTGLDSRPITTEIDLRYASVGLATCKIQIGNVVLGNDVSNLRLAATKIFVASAKYQGGQTSKS